MSLRNGRYNKILIYAAVLLPIILGSAFYIRHNLDEFVKISSVGVTDYMVISVFVIITIFLNGMIIQLLVNYFGLKLRTSEWFGLSVVNTLGNYLPLKVGFVLRAAYLKKAHGFPYTAFVSSMGVGSLIIVLSSGFIGMAGLAAVHISFDESYLALFLLCVAIFCSGLFLIIFSPKVRPSQNKIIKHIYNAVEGWNLIKKDKALLLKIFCINILMIFVYAVRVCYASHALGYDLPFVYALLIGIPAMLSIFVVFVPAGLGVREAIMGFSASMFKETAAAGVVIGALDRIVAMAWVIVLGCIFLWVLSRKINKTVAADL